MSVYVSVRLSVRSFFRMYLYICVCACVRTYVHACVGACMHACMYFVCLCWGLTSQSTIFQSCRDGATASWVINHYFRGVKCLAQGHNTAAVGLEHRPLAPESDNLPLSHRAPACMYVCLVSWRACLSVCVCERAYVPACLLVCLSVICLPDCLSVCLAVCLPVCLLLLSVCLSVCPDFPIQCNNSEVRSKK